LTSSFSPSVAAAIPEAETVPAAAPTSFSASRRVDPFRGMTARTITTVQNKSFIEIKRNHSPIPESIPSLGQAVASMDSHMQAHI